jgi:hypothetical protein
MIQNGRNKRGCRSGSIPQKRYNAIAGGPKTDRIFIDNLL